MILNKMKPYFDTALKMVFGLFLIKNSVVGILIPLEDLGMPPDIYRFIKSLWDTGYLMHLVKLIELTCGLALVFNVFVPLALIVFIPVLVNIYGIHLFVFHSVITSGLYMSIAVIYLLWNERSAFLPLLRFRKCALMCTPFRLNAQQNVSAAENTHTS